MTEKFVDYHCHLIPAIDDGSADLQESLKMARILADFGFGTVHCTPHRIKGCYDNDPARVTELTQSLQRLLEEEGIPLHLVPGSEHYLDEFLIDMIPDALKVSSRYLLVEAPFKSAQGPVTAMAVGMRRQQLAPLLAHPERCSVFDPPYKQEGFVSKLMGKKKELELQGSFILEMRECGCRFQGNLGSFAGYYGSEIKERAIFFLKHGIYSCVGSDAHRSDRLPHILTAGYEAVVAAVGEEEAKRLLTGADLA